MYFLEFLKTDFLAGSDRSLVERKPEELDYKNTYRIFNVPFWLEKFKFVALTVVFDCLLDLLIIYPFRILFSLPRMLFSYGRMKKMNLRLLGDVVHLYILGLALSVLWWYSSPDLYHLIRGQSNFRLYMILNSVQIFDRLLRYMGEYLLMSLWIKLENEKSIRKVSLDILAIAVYLILHTFVLHLEMTVLNIGINTEITSFIVLMVSSSIVQIKIYVFKKHDVRSIQGQSYTDSILQGQAIIETILICCYPNSLNDESALKIFIVFMSRFFLDMIKHIFLVQINGLRPEIYLDYLAHLKEFICCTRLIEKNMDLKALEPTVKFDVKETAIAESKITYPTQKCAFKLSLVILPHFLLIVKVGAEILQRDLTIDNYLFTTLKLVSWLLMMKVASSFVQYRLAQSSKSHLSAISPKKKEEVPSSAKKSN